MNERIRAIHGDSRETLKTLADSSVDSCVCDPPYALVSIVKRFGKASEADDTRTSERTRNREDGYARLVGGGFMGQKWDTGETAHDPDFWREVYRVLKPGAHVVAFGGTRTFHRLVCAIEDAGFEVRDQIAWIFGSGFPKSHDIGKAIDRANGAVREIIAEGKPVKRMIPGADQNRDGWIKDNGREYVPTETAPATEAARAWQGWGTALKPALEPICLARKPLVGTVAANVTHWGTGALNIDACRVETETPRPDRTKIGGNSNGIYGDGLNNSRAVDDTMRGRWPANVIHDGSEEVVGAFPDASGGKPIEGDAKGDVYSGRWPGRSQVWHDDQGSAARFFYSAKADSDDRIGSKHPTVKPIDLMQYLIRLVTPRGGLVLDPFAGTGTTGEAAFREGCRAILIEREPQYFADIQRRISLLLAGPDERQRESIKASGKVQDPGPLFGKLEAAE